MNSGTLNSTSTGNNTFELPSDTVSDLDRGLIVAAIYLMAAVTIAGNLLTIVAFCRDQKLRANISNWYLVNLACADLVVGCVSLPADGATYAYQGAVWSVGEIVCKSLLTVDYIATMGSVCAIILISLDRYWLVTRELQYKMFQTRSKVLRLCLPVWIVISVVTALLIWGYPLLVTPIVTEYMCEAEFLFHREPAIAYSIVTCVVPLALLFYLNTCVYVNVYRRTRRGRIGQQNYAAEKPAEDGKVEMNSLRPPADMLNAPSSSCTTQNKSSVHVNSNGGVSTELPATCTCVHRAKDRRHVRTAKTLAIIVGAYLVCWSPYNITLMITTFSQNAGMVSQPVWSASLYCLWFNSTLNPFLYAMCNVHFRRNFKQMLCWSCYGKQR